MIKDVFVPTRVGDFYLFDKKVLSIEIAAVYVQATLLSFSKKKVNFEKEMKIVLQDHTSAAVVHAIKKIVSQIGHYDELVTSLTSSAIIFKELKLPFIGREKISMVLPYEVEPLLPVSLEEVNFDFIVTQEDVEKKESTIFVAAVRKTDLQHHLHYYEKAGVSLDIVTIDMFALYDFCRNIMYMPQAESSYIMVDFSLDAIRILYLYKGQLQSVRLVPSGVYQMMQKIDSISEGMSHRLLDLLLKGKVTDEDEKNYEYVVDQIVSELIKQIQFSLIYFEKQIPNFMNPTKIFCLGAGTGLYNFKEKVQREFGERFDLVDLPSLFQKKNIHHSDTVSLDVSSAEGLLIPLSATHFGDVNLLAMQESKRSNLLLFKQLLALVLITVFSLGGLYVYSNMQINKWHMAYLGSKKEVSRVVEDNMNLDVRNISRPSLIVDAARETVEREKKLWFSFSKQSENSFLEYLSDLTSKIDRASIGLDLKKLIIDYDQIIMQGKVKNFDALETFEEELMELSKFTVVEKPRELAFTVKLNVKDTSK